MLRYLQRFFLIAFLIFSSCSSPHCYHLAICSIFKNEAPWLKEWLLYHHHVLGVEHFYLYNNESTDHYLEVLEPFIQKGIVELFDWDSKDPKHQAFGAFMDAPWSSAQLGAYNHCLTQKALGKAKWVAMIDIDEFIVPMKGISSFYACLKKAEKKKKGTVSLQWRVFGTSGVQELQEGELLTEKLTFRSSDTHPWNLLVKSIHRPEAIDFCLVHIADKLKPNFGAVTLSADEARIHHYWARTEQFCLEKRNLSKESNPKFFEELNQIEDLSIHEYSKRIKDSFRF